MATSNEDLNKRGVDALERIATSLEGINDFVYNLDTAAWSQRLEWYLNEFYELSKAKTIGESNRPKREYEDTGDNSPV
jgi:hypothetical protein